MSHIISQHKKDIAKAALILFWGIACFAFFQCKFNYHFFYQEQNQLFLLDSNYLSTYLQHPAWVACLLGDFLTQFYYYLYLGPLLLTASLLVLGDLVRRALERQLCVERTKSHHSLLCWVAVIIALIIISLEARLCLDENQTLSFIIALCGGAAMWLIHNIIGNFLKRWWLRAMLLVISASLTYWMFGKGIWLLLIIEALSINIISAIIVCIAAYFLISYLAPSFYLNKEKALTYPGCGAWVDYDAAMNAENNLMFNNEYYWGHYGMVVDLYENMQEEPTDEETFFYCLALSQMQLLPQKIVSMKKPFLGTFVNINSETPLYMISIINELYYIMGDMTYTERAALLANTFAKNKRNVRMMKRLAEANLINGDEAAATKYLRLLMKTLVYRQWAIDHMPATMPIPVKMEIERKRQFINTTEKIRLGDSCYTILTQLLDSNPDNLVALDYLLCSDMLSGERDTFIMDYEKYNGARRSVFQNIYESAKNE